ncbi:hypothetical protein N309_00674, partial [Tinamus guttatus]
EGSPQVVELAAVTWAFENFNKELNVVTDSAYIAGMVARTEQACLKEVRNPHLFSLLRRLQRALEERVKPYFITHIRSQATLPGPMAEGNSKADRLLTAAAVLPDIMKQAKLSHQFFHQNACTLKCMFGLTMNQAQDLISACPDCQMQQIPSVVGTNSRGWQSGQLWQMDVTHIPEFGRFKYVHVSVDTFSGAIVATAHCGEGVKDVKRHLLSAFAMLGVPTQIKTDNGPAYSSRALAGFFQRWGVRHVMGIPHKSPTGQAIVEHAHGSLKRMLEKK